MSTKIIVVTHKKFNDKIIPEGYSVICVGNNSLKKDGGGGREKWLSDANGDNIAEENPWYCELTAQYWAWKNLPKNVDIIGLVHYRRYFMNYDKNSKEFSEDILSVKKIEEIMSKYKIILPYRTAKYPNSSIMYRNRDFDKQDKHWKIIYNIIKENYPSYFTSFKKIIYGKTQVWWNMFIAKRKIFDSYSKWLFEVLKKYDDYIREVLHEERMPRVDGFLAELLLAVYVDKNIAPYEIKYLDVKNTEANNLSYKKNKKGIFRKIVYCNPNILKFMKVSKKIFYVFYGKIFKGL